MDVTRLDPAPHVHIVYDGLAGLSQRPIIRDIVEELMRKGPEDLGKLVAALKRRAASVTIEFMDYVSYGIGGGDASAPFRWPKTMLLWYEPARPATDTEPPVPEHLALRRNPGVLSGCPELDTEKPHVERLQVTGPAA